MHPSAAMFPRWAIVLVLRRRSRRLSRLEQQMEQQPKRELLTAIESSGAEVVATLRALPPEAFARLDPAGEWTGREILAHIASIEWTYPRLIDLAQQAPAPGESRPTAAMRGGNDAYNARQIAKRAGDSVETLIDEFARNRAATIAAVVAVDETLLAVEIRSAGGVTGTLGEVLRWVAVDHVLEHLRDFAL
jgi:hypothetical protein